MKIKRYIVDLVDDGSLAFQLAEKELFMNWNADEVEGEECEDCISRKAVEKLKKYRLSYDTNTTVPKTDIFVKIADIKELSSVTPNAGWIPCSERLPEVGSEVLVCFDFKGNRSVYISDFYGDGEFHGLDDEYLTPEGRKCRKAVAWMPLPHPYKSESEEE